MPPSSCPSSTEPRRRREVGPLGTVIATSLATAAVSLALAALGACGDDGGPVCGPGDAPADGLTLTIDGEAITFGGFTASVNNDCTIAASGVISVSIHGQQVGGAGAITLCLPRPDLIDEGADIAIVGARLPPDAADRVQLVDASATLASGCTVLRDPAVAPAATARFLGYCGDGSGASGYALGWRGTVPLRRSCPAGMDAISGTAGGRVAVTVP